MPERLELCALSTGPEATELFAAALAGCLQQGDVLSLNGDLGAGKTCFTKGLGRALGVVDAITSPTFTLATTYDGPIRFNHLDVYRLAGPEQAQDLDLADLTEDGVTVVEWGDRIARELPETVLRIEFEYVEFDPDPHGDGSDAHLDNHRRLYLCGYGASWSKRSHIIAATLEPWTVPC